jgi:hypothetical protein
MKLSHAILMTAMAVLPHLRATAGVGETCEVAGGIVRNAVTAHALKIAFDEEHEWKGKSFANLPPVWQEMLSQDIEDLKRRLIPVIAATLKKVPAWNAEGFNGMSKAREEILTGLAATNDSYVIRCIKMLD